MKIPFSKYHGTGNDFVIADNRLIHWKPDVEQVSHLCDRHFGIGADGLILLSEREGFEFAMTYYNSDGHESTMCGNGGRCITAFAKSLGLVDREARFWAVDGTHECEISGNGSLCSYRLKIKDTVIEMQFDDGLFMNTGSPHFVLFTSDVAGKDVFNAGRMLREDVRFAPGGTNVDFVELTPVGLFVRTYERGVEHETLSCGTGVTASAIAAAYLHPGSNRTSRVRTPGGALSVTFNQTGALFTEIWLEGPASFVFSGEIEL
jgi:diaminopimelate epimerase